MSVWEAYQYACPDIRSAIPSNCGLKTSCRGKVCNHDLWKVERYIIIILVIGISPHPCWWFHCMFIFATVFDTDFIRYFNLDHYTLPTSYKQRQAYFKVAKMKFPTRWRPLTELQAHPPLSCPYPAWKKAQVRWGFTRLPLFDLTVCLREKMKPTLDNEITQSLAG